MSARLRSRTLDRAAGVLLGGAAGDALGVPYEYGSRALPGPGEHPQMLGGGLGGFPPGGWSDDTAMACVVLEVAAQGADLRSEAALDRVAAGFRRWYDSGPADVGVQTRRVLGGVRAPGAAPMRAIAAGLHARTGRTAGNGSLMRTGPVALAHLGDTEAIVDAARAVSALTHHDPQAGDGCVLWCLAIDRAVRTGELDLRAGLRHVDRAWGAWIEQAEASEPGAFADRNGWVVAALQSAWSAVVRADGLVDGIERAVLGGGDTDTVAAIAGALLGAKYGGSAVPARWRRTLHGWPGLRAADLTRLAVLAVRGGRTDPEGWPLAATIPSYRGAWTGTVAHPDDPGVLLGAVGSRRPGVADAVVSLCRLGAAQTSVDGIAARDTVEIWLVDADDSNLDVAGVLADAASVVADLRREGKTVLLHCVHAQSRTPTVAAAYGALVTGDAPADVLARVVAVLPSAWPRASLVAGLDAAAELLRSSEPVEGVRHDRPGRGGPLVVARLGRQRAQTLAESHLGRGEPVGEALVEEEGHALVGVGEQAVEEDLECPALALDFTAHRDEVEVVAPQLVEERVGVDEQRGPETLLARAGREDLTDVVDQLVEVVVLEAEADEQQVTGEQQGFREG